MSRMDSINKVYMVVEELWKVLELENTFSQIWKSQENLENDLSCGSVVDFVCFVPVPNET